MKRIPHFRRKRPGFTLVELLVVMSIVSLLITLLLPALGRSRFYAQVTTCSTNMRQQGYGMFAYTNDYKDNLPVRPVGMLNSNLCKSYDANPTADDSAAWARDYLNVPIGTSGNNAIPAIGGTSRTILACPGVRGTVYRHPTSTNTANGSTDYYYLSLSTGGQNAGYSTTDTRIVTLPASSISVYFFTRLSQVAEPCRDGNQWNKRMEKPLMIDKMCDGIVWTNTNVTTGSWLANHNLEGGNYLLPDGHIQWEKGDPQIPPTLTYSPYPGTTPTTSLYNAANTNMVAMPWMSGNGNAGNVLLSSKYLYLFGPSSTMPAVVYTNTAGNAAQATVQKGTIYYSQW